MNVVAPKAALWRDLLKRLAWTIPVSVPSVLRRTAREWSGVGYSCKKVLLTIGNAICIFPFLEALAVICPARISNKQEHLRTSVQRFLV